MNRVILPVHTMLYSDLSTITSRQQVGRGVEY